MISNFAVKIKLKNILIFRILCYPYIIYLGGFKIIVVSEPYFDFILSAEGKLMLVLESRAEMQFNPFVVFDGRKLLALFRDKNEIIKLTYIPRKILKVIKNSAEISVTEMDFENVPVRQYRVKIIYDSRLKSKLKREAKYII